MRHHVPVTVGGVAVANWVDVFSGCHSGGRQFAWPDGGSYLEQENLTVVMFSMINEQIRKANDNG